MKVLGPQHVRTVAVLSQGQARQRGLCYLQPWASGDDGGAVGAALGQLDMWSPGLQCSPLSHDFTFLVNGTPEYPGLSISVCALGSVLSVAAM